MTLKDLFDQTSVAQHDRIIVSGDRVILKLPNKTREWLLRGDGEMVLLDERRSELDMAALREAWAVADTMQKQLKVLAKALGLW